MGHVVNIQPDKFERKEVRLMPEKLAVLVQNELNLNLNEISKFVISLFIIHKMKKKSFAQHVTATMLLPVGNHGI